MCGYTPCFRREAGSYGKDVRGLNRLHQFDKVEIVRFETPENSYAALDGMVEHVKGLLRDLELPFRTLRLCGGDLGFTSCLTYDLEVWSAAQGRWLEVSSVSNFETYQSNRLHCRFRNAEGKTELVHTLNGSALALPRIVAALLENHQTEDGIRIPSRPPALHRIRPHRMRPGAAPLLLCCSSRVVRNRARTTCADLEHALMAQVDSAAALFEQATPRRRRPAHATVDSAMAVVEARMQGFVVNLEQGKPFSLLDERTRMLKRQPGRHRRIPRKIDRTRRQIGNLVEAIVDGAKVDAEGSPSTPPISARPRKTNSAHRGHLLEEMDIALDFLERGLRDLDGVVRRADSASIAL